MFSLQTNSLCDDTVTYDCLISTLLICMLVQQYTSTETGTPYLSYKHLWYEQLWETNGLIVCKKDGWLAQWDFNWSYHSLGETKQKEENRNKDYGINVKTFSLLATDRTEHLRFKWDECNLLGTHFGNRGNCLTPSQIRVCLTRPALSDS